MKGVTITLPDHTDNLGFCFGAGGSSIILLNSGHKCQDDGWMTCDFTSFLTVFQSYQDDGRMIMKVCVQWNPVYG